jgi:hypothetical protein
MTTQSGHGDDIAAECDGLVPITPALLSARGALPGPRPDEPLAEHSLRAAPQRTGWRMDVYDDAPHRFFVLAALIRG